MAERLHASSGCACGIDMHTHVVPEHFPAYLGSKLPAKWPSTTEAPAVGGMCHRHVLMGETHFRTISEKNWSVPRRLADLSSMGVAQQVLSPMPELLSYWLDARYARPLLRYINEHMASMVAASGGRFLALGAVPLQDIDLAIAELRYVIETLGFSGVELGSNINGTAIGDPRFDPFFEACEALGAAVFVHALKPTGMDRLVGPAPLQQVLAYPTDVGLSAASVITSNLLLRRPKLRIAFSHGGGTLSALLPRLEQGWNVFPALRDVMQESPSAQARKLFYDALVFDAPTLKRLVEQFGASQLMLGSDYPFNLRDKTPAARIESAGLDADVVAQLIQGNASRFLGLAHTAALQEKAA